MHADIREVDTHAYAHACIHTYIPTYLPAYKHYSVTTASIHMYLNMYNVHDCLRIRIYDHTHVLFVYTRTDVHHSKDSDTHIYRYICTYIYIRIHMYSCIGVFMWYRDIHMQTCIASDCESGLWCCPAAQLHRGSAPASDKFRVLRLSFFSFWVLVCNYRF